MTEKKQRGSYRWTRLETNFGRHPKTRALCAKVADKNAGMYVVRLLAYTMEFAASGRHAPGARAALEQAMEWEGTAGGLISAMLETGWLEQLESGEYFVHDWPEYQGAAVVKAEKDAKRKRDDRERLKNGAGPARAAPRTGAGNVTERNGTERDKEEADQPLQFDLVDPLPNSDWSDQKYLEVIEAWDVDTFWRWCECRRRSFGWAIEKWPNAAKRRNWWSNARNGARPVQMLMATWITFARDKHWQGATPPAPFDAFMKNWNKYLPRAPVEVNERRDAGAWNEVRELIERSDFYDRLNGGAYFVSQLAALEWRRELDGSLVGESDFEPAAADLNARLAPYELPTIRVQLKELAA